MRRVGSVRTLGRVTKLLTAAMIAITALCAGAPPARADLDWSAADTTLQVTGGVLLVADYLQTKRIIDDPVRAEHRESNPIMRRHDGGLGMSPELYFLSVAGAHTLAAVALPKGWRRAAQVALIGVQVYTVGDNWRAGYSLTW